MTEKIRQALNYIGIIGASMMGVVYIIITIILVQGFTCQADATNNIIFALINAVVGICITQMLKIQGITYARMVPENAEILKRYYNTRTKERKLRSITWYWCTSLAKDIGIKGVTVAGATFGIVYLVVNGSHDYHLILLAIANLIMFACFGLLAMNNAYDFYCNEHIPYLKNKLGRLKEVNDAKQEREDLPEP